MLFKQIRSNALKSRRDNSLFFGSLIAAIISFYTLMSIGSLDVMTFLRSIESDAVSKLMMLIPCVYLVSLFFVFFLVYFAYSYQLSGRKKEFGMYLMLGMKKSRLFGMLMGETFFNSIVSILIGIPSALLLTELISFVTARTAGLSSSQHHISFSLSAVLWSSLGFAAVQLVSMLFLSTKIINCEPAGLISPPKTQAIRRVSVKSGTVYLIAGIIFLIISYTTAILKMRTLRQSIFLIVVIAGITGTFLFMRGTGTFIGLRINKKRKTSSGLYIFTSRQIQENVTGKNYVLAVSSLLILIAASCLTFGIATNSCHSNKLFRTVDATVMGTDENELHEALKTEFDSGMIKDCYPMYISMSSDINIDFSGLYDALSANTDMPENVYGVLKDESCCYFISLSGFNHILNECNKEELTLESNETAFYCESITSRYKEQFEQALINKPVIKINGQDTVLADKIYSENIVADKAITLVDSLIIPDEQFFKLFGKDTEPFAYNISLSDNFISENGLMISEQKIDDILAQTGYEYETYLKGIGRNLFYSIAAGYITIYIGMLFLIIANTFIGLKFLMQQRSDRHRYLTLMMLGADTKSILHSASGQVNLFFLLVSGVAAVSSVFAVITMFSCYLSLPAGVTFTKTLLICISAFIVTALIEFIYLIIIKNISRSNIKKLSLSQMEECH